jgi:PBP1b-binding outer membrane lipoprotein LpoB
MKKIITFGICTLLITGCANQRSNESRVSILDDSSRAHLQAELTMADYTAFAEKVTNKMMASTVVQSWGRKRPKLVVGKMRNNTDNESIRIQDIYDRITETILGSGLVRLMDKSATSFDYVVNTELSSTRQYGDGGEELAYFKLEFKMFTIDGEMVGQWSDILPLGKSRRQFM